MERTRNRRDLIHTFATVKGPKVIGTGDIFEFAARCDTRAHILKLRKNGRRLELRARFFTNRVVPPCNSLPESTVLCTSVEAFQRALDLS